MSPLLELAKKASDKETEALKAARDAVSACDAAQQAADKWLGAARELQSAKDPERNNPRLKMITGDTTVPGLGNGEKAAALMLLGRIYAQRIDADESLLADMKIFGEMRPETEFKSDVFTEEVRVSREEAIKRLTDAVNIYKKLGSSAQTTKWVPQAALATAYHLLAHVNPAESATLLASALQAAEEAVKGKEQSPFLADHVLFRDYLRARVGQPTSQPEGETPTTAPEKPADAPEKPAGGG